MLNKHQKLLLFFIVAGMAIFPNFILAAKPIISAGPDQTVYENHSILLQGSALDTYSLNYSWSCTGGRLSDSDILTPVFTAPSVKQNINFTCTLTATNRYSESSSSSVNILVREYALPFVDIKANGYEGAINLSPNGFVILTWDSNNATSCYADDDWSGDKPISLGFERIMNIASAHQYKYTLTCTNPGGSTSDSVIVNVEDPNAPGVTIYANNSRISINVYPHSSIVLNWSSRNADACYASGGWYGDKPTNGVEAIEDITSSKTLIITCTGRNNSMASDQVKVNIIR